MRFTHGQRVRVEYTGTVERLNSFNGELVYVVPDGHDVTAFAHVSGVSAVNPAHWPPKVGDIWEAGGYEYMIRDARSASSTTRRSVGYDKGYLLVSPLDELAPSLRGRLDELLAANPKLLRRRGGFSA